MQNIKKELAPCPFCGGEAVNKQDGEPIYCDTCYSSMPYGVCENDMIELWNTRAPQLQWISVDTDLPKLGQEALILMEVGGNIERGIYIGDGDFKANWCRRAGKNQTYKVAHWMPLPLTPKEK